MRIHSKPNARDVGACLPWVHAEIAAVKPRMLVCMGSTAAQALLGREFRIMRDRGRVLTDSPHAPWVMATIHPSALLRIPDADLKERTYRDFVGDLAKVKAQLATY